MRGSRSSKTGWHKTVERAVSRHFLMGLDVCHAVRIVRAESVLEVRLDFLLDPYDACHEWRLLHLSAVPAIERDEWVARYARDSGDWLCRSTATTCLFDRIAQRQAQAKQGQESSGRAACACRSSAGFARRPVDSFYQQPGRAGPSLGKSATKDCWHLSQCNWGHRFLPHPQLSFDDAQARASHARCSYGCLPWSTFTGRLGT